MAAYHHVRAGSAGDGQRAAGGLGRRESPGGNIHDAVKVAAEAHMGQDDNGVGVFLFLHFPRPFRGFGGFVAELQVLHVGRQGGRGGVAPDDADNGDAFAGLFNYNVRLQVIRGRAGRFDVDVGAQPGERGGGDHGLEVGFGVIVVVVAHVGRAIAQLVHQLHGGHTFGQGPFRGALDRVAGIQQDPGIGVSFYQGGQGGEAAYGAGGILLVPLGGPRVVPAVHVAGVVNRNGQGPGRGGQREEDGGDESFHVGLHCLRRCRIRSYAHQTAYAVMRASAQRSKA